MPRSEPTASSAGSKDGSAEHLLREAGRSADSSEFFSPVPHGYRKGRHKYVVVLGTVMSGLGKGIFSSSLAKLLKDKGLSVAPIKLEGYLNIDSGTLNPYRHGEVFVLADGTECDMDLGTYERMLDQELSRSNFCTSGQVYSTILERERKGGYLGRDVQMIPHVTGEVKQRLRKLAMTGGVNGAEADVVFVEVGGTVGDYENGFYIEALRELAFEEGRDCVCFVALTYVLEPQALGEQKSKAAQLGIKLLMEAGIQPHLIACRAKSEVTETVKQKISMFSNVPIRRVFSMHDRESIYVIPEAMRAEGLDNEVLSQLDLHGSVDPRHEDESRARWNAYAGRIESVRNHKLTLGLAGKYASLRDAYASIDKAIEHASTHLSVDVDVQWMDTSSIIRENAADVFGELGVQALIIPGGFGDRGVEGKIASAEWARESGTPFLGICLGFQCAVIEYTRNVLGHLDAHSTEFTDAGDDSVISELPDQKLIEGLGGSMRLGAQDLKIAEGSLAWWLYRERTIVRERFRHRYEVEPRFIERLEKAGLHFSGRHPEHPIMQVLELDQDIHPYYVAAQFHPELTSRPVRPQPMFMGLIAAAVARTTDRLEPDDPISTWLRSPVSGTSAAGEGGPAGSISGRGGIRTETPRAATARG
ncbi:MAG: glutamine hydrolyzing CTP synthase [Phycisphaerales bacterium]